MNPATQTIPVTREQVEARRRLKALLDNLRTKQIGMGTEILCRVEKSGEVSVWMVLRDGLRTISTKPYVFHIDGVNRGEEYERICRGLRSEYLALHAADFDKTYLPVDFVEDGSPVHVAEDVAGSEDVYF